MKIKEITKEYRPREKLLKYTSANLTNLELLAIILVSGTKNNSVIEICNNILKENESLEKVTNLTYEQLIKIKGIKTVKAIKLLALFELMRRYNTKDILGEKITSPYEIFLHYKNIIGNKDREHFYVIYLNHKNMIVSDKLLFIGTYNEALIEPKIIFKEAIINDISKIIILHNHPSGDVTPSKEDIKLTKKIIEIGAIFNICLLDHIIISREKYISIKECGKI